MAAKAPIWSWGLPLNEFKKLPVKLPVMVTQSSRQLLQAFSGSFLLGLRAIAGMGPPVKQDNICSGIDRYATPTADFRAFSIFHSLP